MTASIDELKARADELGIQYGARIGAETLAERIAEAESGEAQESPSEPQSQPERPRGSTFDPGKPHGLVLGQGQKARYFQDGKYFDSQGSPCDGP